MTSKRAREADHPDRERGILTQADRELLLGEKDLQPQSEREARQRIRSRFENAMLDIVLLRRNLRDDDRKPVAESVFPDNDEGDFNFQDSLQLLFRLVLDSSENVERALERWEEIGQYALRNELTLVEENPLIAVNLEVLVENRDPDIDKLLTKYNNDEETFEELMYLRNQNEIEYDETYEDHLYEHLWEQGESVAIRTGEEMAMIDPEEYDSPEEFRREIKGNIDD